MYSSAARAVAEVLSAAADGGGEVARRRRRRRRTKRQALAQRRPGVLVDALGHELVQRRPDVVAEGVVGVRCVAPRADDREALGQHPGGQQAVEAGQQLAPGEVAARAEDDDHVRVGCCGRASTWAMPTAPGGLIAPSAIRRARRAPSAILRRRGRCSATSRNGPESSNGQEHDRRRLRGAAAAHRRAPAGAAPVTLGSPLTSNFTQTTSSSLATGANTALPEPGAYAVSPIAGAAPLLARPGHRDVHAARPAPERRRHVDLHGRALR